MWLHSNRIDAKAIHQLKVNESHDTNEIPYEKPNEWRNAFANIDLRDIYDLINKNRINSISLTTSYEDQSKNGSQHIILVHDIEPTIDNDKTYRCTFHCGLKKWTFWIDYCCLPDEILRKKHFIGWKRNDIFDERRIFYYIPYYVLCTLYVYVCIPQIDLTLLTLYILYTIYYIESSFTEWITFNNNSYFYWDS